MARPKMTFTLDQETAARLERASRLTGLPKSGVVREAVAEYAARLGALSDDERRHLLEKFDELIARIPERPAAEVDAELAVVRAARRAGGRRS